MTVLELRQYTMVPGRRDDFVDIFDREFVETQEALGIEVIGQFRDLDRPDRYVWMRRFADMEKRKAALERFYDGPVWARHANAANATMTEWHDVLLLKPASQGGGFRLDGVERQAAGGKGEDAQISVAIWPVAPERMAEFSDAFQWGFPAALAAYVTDGSENTFPRLPIREGESVFVGAVRGAMAQTMELDALATGTPTRLNLAPTPRSLLR